MIINPIKYFKKCVILYTVIFLLLLVNATAEIEKELPLQVHIEKKEGDYRFGFIENCTYGEPVKIHFIEKNWKDKDLPTIVFSAGIWEPGERALPLFDGLDCHSIAFSYRGRGKSDTPARGYDLEHHLSDFETVVDGLGLNKFSIVAFSRGVGYASGYVSKHPQKVDGMVLVDHPPIHVKPWPGYADFWKKLVYLGEPITDFIRPVALDGLQAEAREVIFWDALTELNIPVYILWGSSAGANIKSELTQADISKYKEVLKDPTFVEFKYSGHMIVDEELGKYREVVKEFLSDIYE